MTEENLQKAISLVAEKNTIEGISMAIVGGSEWWFANESMRFDDEFIKIPERMMEKIRKAVSECQEEIKSEIAGL